MNLLAAFAICASRARNDGSTYHRRSHTKLLLNYRPDVSEPLFQRDVDYFVSSEAIDPLKPIATLTNERSV